MRRPVIHASVALLASFVSIPLAAETVSTTVPYGDLDLATENDQATLRARVGSAVQEICGSTKNRVPDVRDGSDHQRCLRLAKASAALELARVTGGGRAVALSSTPNPRR
jgi:UrcA family protein